MGEGGITVNALVSENRNHSHTLLRDIHASDKESIMCDNGSAATLRVPAPLSLKLIGRIVCCAPEKSMSARPPSRPLSRLAIAGN